MKDNKHNSTSLVVAFAAAILAVGSLSATVTNMVNGRKITNREALGNPESLDYFEALLPELQK